MQYDHNRPDSKYQEAYKKELERLFGFICDELAHDETLSRKEFKENLQNSLNKALDVYERMKPYVLYNPVTLDYFGGTWTWNGVWFESSEIWLPCNPEGYVENEMDERIDAAYLRAIENLGLDAQVHFYGLKMGNRLAG